MYSNKAPSVSASGGKLLDLVLGSQIYALQNVESVTCHVELLSFSALNRTEAFGAFNGRSNGTSRTNFPPTNAFQLILAKFRL